MEFLRNSGILEEERYGNTLDLFGQNVQFADNKMHINVTFCVKQHSNQTESKQSIRSQRIIEQVSTDVGILIKKYKTVVLLLSSARHH